MGILLETHDTEDSVPRRARRPGRVTTETGVHRLLRHYARTRDEGSRQAIIAHYQGLVRSLARRFLFRSEALDDLIQVGEIGLIRAVDKYDPSRALPFPVYAAPSILGELKHHFRDKTWAVRVPRSLQERLLQTRKAETLLHARLGRRPTVAQIAQEMHTTEEAVLEAMETGRAHGPIRWIGLWTRTGEDGLTVMDRVGVWDADMHAWETYTDLARALSCLNPREREILRLRFWEDCSQSEVAERLGLSQMHVSRLQARALARLKGILADEVARR